MNILRILYLVVILSLICCTAEAVTLDITVRDDDDNSRIASASIYIDDDYVGKTDDIGEFSYSHSYDEPFVLEVIKSGYDEWTDTIDEDETSVNVYLTCESTSFLVSVYDADTIEPVRDARVKVTEESTDESESEWVDTNGEAEFELTPDETYEIVITASGYETVTRSIETDENEMTLRCWLMRSDRFSFRVVDTADQDPIPDASVYIDGSFAGTTGTTGILTTSLVPGRYHDIRIVCSGYTTFQQNTYVDEDDIIMDVSLSWSGHTVAVSVLDDDGEPVKDAAVSIDGSAAVVTDSGGTCTLGDIAEGSRTITVVKDGYDTWRETRTITGDADISVRLAPATTEVSVLVENTDHQIVSGALVSVNGEAIGLSDAAGCVKESIVSSGVCNFTASLEGYIPASVKETILPGTAAASVTITLEKENGIGSLLPLVVALTAVVLVVVLIRWHTANRYLPPRRGRSL